MPLRIKKPKLEKSALLTALDFIALVQREESDDIRETHCRLEAGVLSAHNGITAASMPIAEQITGYPASGLFRRALAHCGESLTIAELADGRLKVQSKNFSATLPCVAPDSLLEATADVPLVSIDRSLIEALTVAADYASDTAESVLASSVRLRSGSCFGTNRTVLLEVWHGYAVGSLDIALPKRFIAALAKCAFTPVAFGCSAKTATVHYDNGAWLQTQLYANTWPNVDEILNVKTEPVTLPEKFFEAVAAVKDFSERKDVYLNSVVSSHADTSEGAYVDIGVHLPLRCFSAADLLSVREYVETIDFVSSERCLYFWKGNIRGAISAKRIQK